MIAKFIPFSLRCPCKRNISLLFSLLTTAVLFFSFISKGSDTPVSEIGSGGSVVTISINDKLGLVDPKQRQSIVERRVDEHRARGKWLLKDCSNRMYYFANINTCFRAVPKSGNSNWKDALLMANGDFERLSTSRKELSDHHKFANNYHIKNLHISEQADILKDAFCFTTIRNPWVRMVSGYTDKLSKITGDTYSFIEIRMEILDNARGLGGDHASEIPTFVEFAEWLAAHEGNVDAHFTPQTSIMCLHNTSYDYIVPLEYAQEYSEVISRGIGAKTSIPHSYDGTSVLTQRSTINAKEWLPKLDTELIDKLYQIFKSDFLLMDYTNFTDPRFPFPLF